MCMPSGWVQRSVKTGSAIVLFSVIGAALLGCRTNPTNPFLEADADYDYPNGASDPLAESLGRLKDRGKELKGAAATATDTAQALRDDAAAIVSDTTTETRQAVATSLDQAQARGQQLAYDAAIGAAETAKAAGSAAQLDAVASLEDLPLEQAGPILLVTMSRGTPAMQRAAAEQLARRWPPAAGYSSAEIAQQQRDAALAELRQRWSDQYGQINEAVAAAQLQAAGAIDEATAAVDTARGVVDSASAQMRDVQQLVSAYREAELPTAAREELARSLEQLSASADKAVRVRAVQAMGETADPVFMPALLTMLNDQPEVRAAALASLERTAGKDVTKPTDGRTLSAEERARAWQLWYREQQDRTLVR